MNDLLSAVALGAVQGLTEFLPVSSSGHLVLAQQALGENFEFASNAVLFDLVLHAGTLLPVLFFYRSELLKIVASMLPMGRKNGDMDPATRRSHRLLGLHVTLATVPTGIIGICFKSYFEALFHNVTAVCVALAITGALLLATRKAYGRRGTARELSAASALLIGLVQGLAITPGISRSGSTIAVALLLGIDREVAARFSFLLSIPAICGAIAMQMSGGFEMAGASSPALLAGFASAMFVGYGSLVMLVALVKNGGLHRFAYYLWPAAAAAYFALG